MSVDQALAFALFATVAAVTPGPSNVMLTVTGAVAGVVRGLPCLLGVGAGMALMMFAVAFGLGGAVLAHPTLLAAFKAAGAAFLLWLAWRIASAPPGAQRLEGRPVGFLGAFAFQWLNPKSWLVSTSAAGAYLRADAGILVQALSIGGIFFAVAVASGLLWLALGVAMNRLLASARLRRAFNVAMGALLAMSVLFLLS